MTPLRLLFAVLLASTTLISCDGGIGRVDSRYPSVSQQDAYDVSWGLPPRKSRGNPKLRYQYNAKSDYSQPESAAPSAPAPSAPAPAPAPAPNTAPISPTIPPTLR
ncbi:hypothetical protein [Prosthecobacter sp.]|uniref:hypothetical protein n=1 Tax=Prosthecobacter sp. TaxID=1965333 RepID=UPI002ABA7B22|nr:hypothetical protein [Prosthecobacter sp.]MDZ4403916.1 hypothetical protein [Prosthecobacter sp.]